MSCYCWSSLFTVACLALLAQSEGFILAGRNRRQERDRAAPTQNAKQPPQASSRQHSLSFATRLRFNGNGNNNGRDVDDRSLPRYPWGKSTHSILFQVGWCLTRFIMNFRNRVVLHDPDDNLRRYVLERDTTKTSLLTYSNHCSVWDDPGIWVGVLSPFSSSPSTKHQHGRLTLDNWRSTMMDENMYYIAGNLSADFFRGTNTLPVRRGDRRGVQCPSLQALHARLTQEHQWCHIFCEGRILQPWRYRNDEPWLGKLRPGTAKLVCCSDPDSTIVLPIYHCGMHRIAPETPPPDNGSTADNRSGKTESWIPTGGNTIHVYVGDPLDVRDLVVAGGMPFDQDIPGDLLQKINKRLRSKLLELEKQATCDRQSGANAATGN